MYLVITWSRELGFGCHLVKIDPRSLPELFQQPRDLEIARKPRN